MNYNTKFKIGDEVYIIYKTGTDVIQVFKNVIDGIYIYANGVQYCLDKTTGFYNEYDLIKIGEEDKLFRRLEELLNGTETSN